MSFYQKDNSTWNSAVMQLFAGEIPQQYEWSDLNEIHSVLKTISSYENSHHLFYPTGGIMAVENVTNAAEEGCLELKTDSIEILKPKRLIFECFGDLNSGYFRLETDELIPSGVYDELEFPCEELTEIKSGHYISRVHWDEDSYNGEKLPENARIVTRHLNGTFVLFAKDFTGYDFGICEPIHNELTAEEFSEFISKNVHVSVLNIEPISA